ncbi:hypothetical protein PV08_03389 [Exophiala spinifera]|uniref:DUF6594 domain-containing protein n=1 Tax=Exophiala spinifera TaxID=91928 RepID=A0A0D2A2E3_9EURO|nr:uncharacterized protein PV08_03389 [Exophiala spinifera]KIW19097.1 hypothetical protein PV08_03389 [Exophiala spinifera]
MHPELGAVLDARPPAKGWLRRLGRLIAAWGHDPPTDSGTLERQIESYRRGYPRFSAVIAADDSFCLCRRFSNLRSRLLLLKQDKLSVLEKKINEVDEWEPRALFLGKSRCDVNQERLSLLAEADERLADYDLFVERTSRMLSSRLAGSRARVSLQNWVSSNGCIAREETEYLQYARDLISLAPAKDGAMASLESRVEDIFIRFFKGFLQVIALRRLRGLAALPQKPCKLRAIRIFESQFEQTRDENALTRAIEIAQMAVSASPPNSPARPVLLNTLSNKLLRQYKISGGIEHIRGSVATAEEALDSLPPSTCIPHNCASKLDLAFDRNLDSQYLLRAVIMAQEAVDSTNAHDEVKRAGRLDNLGILLRRQYEQSKDAGVLDGAIKASRESVSLTPPGYIELGSRRSTLSSLLSMQFEHTKNPSYLDEAIQEGETAMGLTPQGHSERLDMLNNLRNKYQLRHIKTGDQNDVDSAIRLAGEAIRLMEEDAAQRSPDLVNLTELFRRRYNLFKETQDLDEAIRIIGQITESMSERDSD